MFACRLGSPTDTDQTPLAPGECSCDASCELHQHYSDGEDRRVVCYHDGEHDHAHCPQTKIEH